MQLLTAFIICSAVCVNAGVITQTSTAPAPVASTTAAPENYLGGFFKREYLESRGDSVPDTELTQSNSNDGAPEDYLGGFFKRGDEEKNDDAANDSQAPENYLGGFF